MIVDNNEENFIFLSSSFTLARDSIGIPEEQQTEVIFNTGACLSTTTQATGVVPYSEKGLLGGKGDEFYLGISSDLSGAFLTGVVLIDSQERAKKKEDNESFWTWFELFKTGKHIGLETDIVFDAPVNFNGENYGAFEEYDEPIFRVSYSEKPDEEDGELEYFSKIFNKEQQGELVLFSEDPEDPDEGKTEYYLEGLSSYRTGEKKTEMAIIDFDEKLIINL